MNSGESTSKSNVLRGQEERKKGRIYGKEDQVSGNKGGGKGETGRYVVLK